MIITRFAPSPTGYLHIGGARTALYNYLWAKHNNGKFLLRMEDTDRARSTKEFADQIMTELKWLGIEWDNDEIPFQSDRLELYNNYKEQLLAKQLAYSKDGAIYLKGNNDDVEDFVIFKSDGMPTFHFAVVVDDHEMGANCIIRGVDHLTNTLKHKLIYNYLGWTIPEYYHIPLIVDENNKPLSKRRNDVATSYYMENHYLGEAVLNFLARLGWGYKDQEIFTKQELIELFEIAKVSKSAARFDTKKFNWLNTQYIKKASIEQLKRFDLEHLQKLLSEVENETKPAEMLAALQQKAFDIKELDFLATPFITRPDITSDLLNECKDFISNHLSAIIKLISDMPPLEQESLDITIKTYMETNNLGMKQLAMPLRILLTGQKKSLDVASIMIYLGKDETLKRLSIHTEP